jgi:hypothetical protein
MLHIQVAAYIVGGLFFTNRNLEHLTAPLTLSLGRARPQFDKLTAGCRAGVSPIDDSTSEGTRSEKIPSKEHSFIREEGRIVLARHLVRHFGVHSASRAFNFF